MRRAVWCVRFAGALGLGFILMEYMPGAWALICAVLVGLLMTTSHYLIITTPERGKDHVVRTKNVDDPQGPRPDPR
jgi:hypothetical protein